MKRFNVAYALVLMAALLDVLWIYPWFAWTSGWTTLGWPRPPLSLAGAVLVAACVAVATRLALGTRWPLGYIRAMVLGAMVLVLALALRLELGAGYSLWDPEWGGYAFRHISAVMGGLAFGAYVGWRGIAAGREEVHFDGLYARFLIGLSGLAVLILVWGLASRSAGPSRAFASVGPYVVAYFGVGLLGLALVNLRAMRDEMLRREGTSALLGRRWLSLLLGVVVGIIVVGVAFVSFFSFDLARPVFHVLGILGNGLLIVFLYVVGLPLSVLVAGLVYVGRWLVHLVGQGARPQSFNLPTPGEMTEMAEGGGGVHIPEAVVVALKWGLVVLVAVLVIALLARAVSRYLGGRRGDDVEEVHESLFSWSTLVADFGSILRGILRRLRRRKATPPPMPAPPVAVGDEGGDDRLFGVREIYQGLLWEARTVGFGRRPPQTPYEYELALRRWVLGEERDLQAITAAYVEQRYGRVEASGDELRALNGSWRRVRAVLRSRAASAGQGETVRSRG